MGSKACSICRSRTFTAFSNRRGLTCPDRLQCNLGFFYDRAERYDKALEWYMKGARQGCEVCENNLGCLYKHGWGVEKNIDTALEWFTKSAEKGYAKAQNQAGVSTTPRDETKRRSSGSRNRPLKATLYAQSQPRACYEKAKGVKKDISRGAQVVREGRREGRR